MLLHDTRAVLAALLTQWLGLVWVEAASPTLSPTILGLTRGGAVELVTAFVCIAVLGTTLRNLRTASDVRTATDYLLPAAVILLGGLAGVGFALLFPLTGEAQQGLSDLIFYWALLSGALVLLLDGARSPVKLAAGLLVLLNAAALSLSILSVTAPSAAVLGLMSITRIGMAFIMSYGLALLASLFNVSNLEPLFAGRDRQADGADQGETTGELEPTGSDAIQLLPEGTRQDE